jgi:hypothetical protein
MAWHGLAWPGMTWLGMAWPSREEYLGFRSAAAHTVDLLEDELLFMRPPSEDLDAASRTNHAM